MKKYNLKILMLIGTLFATMYVNANNSCPPKEFLYFQMDSLVCTINNYEEECKELAKYRVEYEKKFVESSQYLELFNCWLQKNFPETYRQYYGVSDDDFDCCEEDE